MPIDPAALDHFLSWEGAVGRSFKRRVDRTQELIALNAPIRMDSPGPHLADTIGHNLSNEPRMLIADIGANPEQHVRGYAIIVAKGSMPHAILPNPPRKSLRFRVAGRIVYAHRVAHPGTQPDHYLTRWLRELL